MTLGGGACMLLTSHSEQCILEIWEHHAQALCSLSVAHNNEIHQKLNLCFVSPECGPRVIGLQFLKDTVNSVFTKEFILRC